MHILVKGMAFLSYWRFYKWRYIDKTCAYRRQHLALAHAAVQASPGHRVRHALLGLLVQQGLEALTESPALPVQCCDSRSHASWYALPYKTFFSAAFYFFCLFARLSFQSSNYRTQQKVLRWTNYQKTSIFLLWLTNNKQAPCHHQRQRACYIII